MWPRWFPFPHFLIIKIMNTYCRKLGRHRKVKVKVTHCVCLFATPWTIACKTPLPMELSRQEYWSRLPFPFPEDIPNPEIKPRSPALQVDSLPAELYYLIRMYCFCLLIIWPRCSPFCRFLIITIMNTYFRNLGRHRKVS